MSAVVPPFLSQFDPLEQGEGSIDPLGLAAGYDQLADNLLPGITVRMGRPRFLTLIAVGAHVCRDIDSDALAADQVSLPYLVFEWWLLEAFHRSRESLAEQSGIPGLRKVGGTIRAGRRVSASGYLKVPSVFGFTGVFRRLAVRARILTQTGMLDDEGHRLVELWARERGLDGFTLGSRGSGAEFRSDLLKAVREGLANGHTGARPAAFWERVAQHLDPSQSGRRERALLTELIESHAGDAEEVRCLTRVLCERTEALDPLDEPDFVRRVARNVPPRLCSALEAIDAYESLCQPLTQAFNWIRYLASDSPSVGVDAQQYLKSAPAASLVLAIRRGISRVAGDQVIAEKWKTRSDTLLLLREGIEQEGLFETALELHQEAQRRKPPQPKRLWLEPTSSGRWLIRAAYRLAEAPSNIDAYVHEYRLPTLSRFLAELGELS